MGCTQCSSAGIIPYQQHLDVENVFEFSNHFDETLLQDDL